MKVGEEVQKENFIILRYSDFEIDNIDTIDLHVDTLKKCKKVYWGWFNKEYETLTCIAKRRTWHYCQDDDSKYEIKLPITVYLFNREKNIVYLANCSNIKKLRMYNHDIDVSEQKYIPSYYRTDSSVKTFFEFYKIEKVNYDEFVQNCITEKIDISCDATFLYAGNNTLNHDYIDLDSEYILHISDLHFGSFCRYIEGNIDPRNNSDCKLLDKIIIEENKKIGLIIVSGDFVHGKDRKSNKYKESFNKAKEFLKALCEKFELNPYTHLLLVPGNHDKGYIEDSDGKISAIDNKTQNNYEEDYREFQKSLINEQNLSYVRKYRLNNSELKLNFLCLDSSYLQSEQKREYGFVSLSKLKYMENTDDDALKMVVMHYPIVPPPSAVNLVHYTDENGKSHTEPISILENAFSVASKLTEKSFKIIFHGHQHYPYSAIFNVYNPLSNTYAKLACLGVGSLGLNQTGMHDDFSSNSYNVCKLGKDKLEVCYYKFNTISSSNMFISQEMKLV